MDDNSEFIDKLILSGALEPKGLDPETGEIVFSFTEKLEAVDPELYRGFNELIHMYVMELWQKGYIAMDVMSPDPKVSMTEYGMNTNNWAQLEELPMQILKTLMQATLGEL